MLKERLKKNLKRAPRHDESPKAHRRRTQVIGAVVIAVAALVVAFAYLRPDPLAHKETVKALFTDSSGIGAVGAEVRMAGVPVGEITSRDLEGDKALVTMKIDEGAGAIHRDATASLRPNLIFEGTAFVDLDPGSPSAPELGDGTIPATQTRSYVPIDKALRVLDPDTRAAFKGTTKELSETFQGEGLTGLHGLVRQGPKLTRTLAGAARAAQGPSGTELGAAVRHLAGTTNAIASRSRDLEPLVVGADRTLAAVDTGAGRDLDGTIRALPPALTELDRGGREVRGIVDRLDPLAHELRPGLHQLAPTLRELTPLVRSAGPTLTKATPLIGDLRGALDEGAQASAPVRTAINQLDPSVRTLKSSLLPALHRKTDELHVPAYVSFLNLFGGGGGASKPFQTAANSAASFPSGTGHFMRFGLRFLTGVGVPVPQCALLAAANPQLAGVLAQAGGCTP